MSMKNKINSFFWNAIGNTLNSFLSLFLLIIVTQINGINTSGKFSFVFSVTLVFQAISNYGSRNYQISDYKKEFSFNEYFVSRIYSSLLAVILLVIYCIISKFDLIILYLFIFFIILRIIESFSEVMYGEFQVNDRLDLVGKSLCLKSVFILIVFTILELIFKNILIAVIGMVLVALSVFLFYDLNKIKGYKKLKYEFNYNVYQSGKYIFLSNFLSVFFLNIPRFISNYTLSSVEIGYLGILIMIPTIMLLVCQFIIQPNYLIIVNLYKEKKLIQYKKIVKKNVLFLLICGSLAIIVAMIFGSYVLEKLYGLSFEGYIMSFIILIVSGTFNGIIVILSNLLTIARKTKIQLYIYIMISILNMFLSYFLSKAYSLYGIFFALVISIFIQLLCLTIVVYIKIIRNIKYWNG